MAVLVNFDLAESRNLKNFESLAMGTNNATNGIIESSVALTSPSQAKKFHEAFYNYEAASRKKMEFVLRNGQSNEELERNLDKTQKRYFALRGKHESDPSLAFLNDPIHRKEFDVKPYPIKGKHAPPNLYLGANSAMDGIWPGYDKPEYFEQYPFLRKYEAQNPGKALQAFLHAHGLFYHFPETVSRYGVLFVPPPYTSEDMNVELRQHLSKCDALFHTAPKVSADDTVEEVRLVLSYVEDDMVAIVEDNGGQCIGVVGWEDLQNVKDGAIVSTFCKKHWNEAPKDKKMSAEEAFNYMEDDERNWPYMLQFTEHGTRIVTQTTASVSHFLPPNLFKDGLGSALYFGISDTAIGDKLINRLEKEADGVQAAYVETAHADTPFYRTILAHYRQKLQDIFLMAGTTIDPMAVLDFLDRYGADGVKLGIAEGTACRTSKTGIALPNAHVGMECGAIAYERGYLQLDGWGHSDEFIKALAMSGIQSRQGGGAFMGRREAANPTVSLNGVRGKYYRGMAGADVQQAVLGQKAKDPIKRMEARAHLHSEGAEVFVPLRSPSTVGRMLLAHMFLLKSAMSYEGVRAELESKKVPEAMRELVLKQFQRMAKLYAVMAA